MFTTLNEDNTFRALVVFLLFTYLLTLAVMKVVNRWRDGVITDRDSVRDSMNYQAYIDARKVGVDVVPPFEWADREPTNPERLEDVLAVPTLTEVRTHRPSVNGLPPSPYRSRDGFPDAPRPRPIRDNPQA